MCNCLVSAFATRIASQVTRWRLVTYQLKVLLAWRPTLPGTLGSKKCEAGLARPPDRGWCGVSRFCILRDDATICGDRIQLAIAIPMRSRHQRSCPMSALLHSAIALYSIRGRRGWCQDGMTMILREVPMSAYNAEQRDTRERRSITAFAAFTFRYLHTLTNSASEVSSCAVLHRHLPSQERSRCSTRSVSSGS